MTQDDYRMRKGILWEEAKGKLRALKVVEAYRRTDPTLQADEYEQRYQRAQDFDAFIEGFIEAFESENMQH